MSYTTPFTATAGVVLTAATWNASVRDDTSALKAVLDGSAQAFGTQFFPTTDANFKIYNNAGVFMLIQFDTGTDDLYYDRTNNVFHFRIGGAEKLLIDANGKLTGAGFYDSGEFTVASTATALVSHGLGAEPRFVSGWGGNPSGSLFAPLTPALATPAGQVYINIANTTQIQVSNQIGSSKIVRVFAML